MSNVTEPVRVSATTRPLDLAGLIAGVMRERGRLEMQAVGAGAINVAVKAIAIARGYVAPGGMELVLVPSFIDIAIEGEERRAIRLLVETR